MNKLSYFLIKVLYMCVNEAEGFQKRIDELEGNNE